MLTVFRRYILIMVLFASNALFAADADVEHFQDIASRLDIGGDVFLVINTGRWLDQVMERLAGTDGAMPPASADERDFREMSGRVRRFVARHGISSFQGLGVSSVPLQGGHSRLKIFLLRDPHDANLPFWRGVFGWQPRRLLSLDFLPANTQFAIAGTPDPSGIWGLLQSAIDDLQPSSFVKMTAWLKQISEKYAGESVEMVLENVRDEVLFGARRVDHEGAYVWEWVAVIGAGDALLFDALKTALDSSGGVMEDVGIGGYRMQRFHRKDEDGEALTRSLAFATVPGFLVFGNSHLMVEDALRSQRHRSGLVSRPAFRDAFRGQSMVNNGILYISQEGTDVLRSLHSPDEKSASSENASAFSYRLLEELSGQGLHDAVFALTFSNWKQGIMVSGRSGVGGAALGSWMGALPWRYWLRLSDFIERYIPENK